MNARANTLEAVDAVIQAAGGSAAQLERIQPVKAICAHELAGMQFKQRETGYSGRT